jgi:hypothetical protein
MNTPERFSAIPNQMKTDRLHRSPQPDSESNERGDVTGKGRVKLDWAVDKGYLQWQSDNHLFVVYTKGNKNQRVEIDLSTKSSAPDTIKAELKQPVPMFPDKPEKNTEQQLQDFIPQQPYRDSMGEAIVAFQARPAAATGMGTHNSPLSSLAGMLVPYLPPTF